MAISNAQAGRPVTFWDEGSPSGGSDVGSVLSCLAEPGRLAVLGLLAQGVTGPDRMERVLGVPEGVVRHHLGALAAVGLISGDAVIDHQTHQLLQQAVHLMGAALRSKDFPGSAPVSNGHALPGDVPPPPLACTMCDSSGYVAGVLDELSTSLRESQDYHSRLQEMSSQVLTAHETERKRIARELHDDTAQALASMIVRLRLLERETNDSAVLANVEELREITSQALDSVRRMAMDLRPASLDDLGLVPALEALGDRFNANTATSVAVDGRRLRRRLPRDVELVLYRVAQEALTNIGKHAEATSARITLKSARDEVTLVIEDDGIGFEGDRATSTNGTGLGLFGMKERLALVSGDLNVDSVEGKGTRITAHVPIPRRISSKED